jgi:hypothetical protein
MRGSRRTALLAAAIATVAGVGIGSASGAPPKLDGRDAYACARYLKAHGDANLSPAQRRACVISISTTYIEAEQNSIPPTKILLHPEVSRYCLGAEPEHAPGNDQAIRDSFPTPIRSIEDREWTADRNEAYITYAGFTTTAGETADYLVAERFRLKDGLIWEILISTIRYVTPTGQQAPLPVC